MFERINKRRLKLLKKLIFKTRFNADLMRYAINRLHILRLNRLHDTTIAYPTNGMIELGNQCNLHCIMCPREFQYGKEMDKGYMPLERAKQIIDEMYPYLDSIGLTGLGETMLYPHLLDVVCPDVQIEAVLALHGVFFPIKLITIEGADRVAWLPTDVAESVCLTHTLPIHHWLWPFPAEIAHWRCRIRNASEHCYLT